MLSPAAVSGVAAGIAANDTRFPFSNYATAKLAAIDAAIIGPLKAEAEKAWREKRFPAAIGAYKTIQAEYEGMPPASEAALKIRLITIAMYNWNADESKRANRFDEAKAWYRKILAEYHGSSEANDAASKLRDIIPKSITGYRATLRIGQAKKAK